MDVRFSRRSVRAALMAAPLFVLWSASAQEQYRRMIRQTLKRSVSAPSVLPLSQPAGIAHPLPKFISRDNFSLAKT